MQFRTRGTWRRRSVLAMIMTPLVAAAAVLAGPAPANAASNVAVTYGFGTAHLDSFGYYGDLRDTTTPDGYCVEMQRKTSTGDWVTSGFWSTWDPDGGSEIHVVACSTSFVYWHIRNTGAIYGLRLHRYASGPATDFCSSKLDCLFIGV